MAKRKRLTPARLDAAPAPEVKSALARPALSSRPPIADVAQDAAASAALSEIAEELTEARTSGRLIQKLPLSAIDADFLVRDRVALEPEAQQSLVDSLTARGQQTPVEVSDLGDGRYGLISGFRRHAALREIHAKNPALDTVLAIVRPPQEASQSYQAMVEENEVRVDLSFYERGRIVARAKDAGVFRTDAVALGTLFAHVPRAKRSKIGSFVTVVRALDGALQFPVAISEKLGLALAKQLAASDGFVDQVTGALERARPATPADELRILSRVLTAAETGEAETPALPAAAMTLSPGFKMTQRASGKIELTGDKMQDPIFVARLIKTLKSLK